MPYIVHPFRFRARVLALVCVAAACMAQARAADAPAILRTDAFVAAQYDANTVLVFFNTVVMPPALGAPAGAWPPMSQQGAAAWAGAQTQLRLTDISGEMQWRQYWPGGEAYAPKLGGAYALALGGNRTVHGILSSVGYLAVCDSNWLVGLVSVDEADRSRYASAAAVGMVAYQAEQNVSTGEGQSAEAPAVGSAMGSDRILNVFPLSALPMLDQGDGDSAHQTIVLTEARTADSLVFSLKRITPGGLVDAGVVFENRCK
jgi:hypothetical protein